MRLGLFGGTFDPPHIGHLIVAQDALTALRLDRIIFIPAGVPPHKRDRAITPAADRLHMLQRAIAADARFTIEPMELERSGPSYSVDTAEALSRKHPGAELFLLIGVDQFREFRTWREPARLASLVRVAIISRGEAVEIPAYDIEAFGAQRVKVSRIDISSTEIRRRAAAGESIRYLVPPGVEEYLTEHRIYDQ